MPSIRQRGRRSLRVFLSYRRDDASGHAGRLYDSLTARYGVERVFMDIDTVPLGSEFPETISRSVASCDVLVALIGRRWLQSTDAEGKRRLDDPDDFVRREIESALTQGVLVVPTCVQGAEMPRAEDLPPSLVALTRRQGAQLSDLGWRDDVTRLLRRLETLEREQPPPSSTSADAPREEGRRRPSGRTLAAIALGALVLVAGLAALLLRGSGGGGGGGESTTPAVVALPSGVSRVRGTETLGSDLRTPPTGAGRWYCSGSAADTPCTFALTRLPEVDRLVTARFDGVVTRWRVQGAGGPIRLIVMRGDVRPGHSSVLARAQGSGEQEVHGGGRHDFRTRLRIGKGDAVGLQFSVGAYGNAPYAQGTWLEEWIPPLAGERRASNSGSAHDYELLYNATIEPDRDGDGFGDLTQDRCPQDRSRQHGC